MKKLSPQGVKVLKMFHIFFAFAWIIGAIGMTVVLFATDPQTGDELFMRSRVLLILDDYLIIGGAFGALITGLLYSIFTNWGFFKHNWITVKWILTILQMLFGTFVLGPCINNNVIIADSLRDAAFYDPQFMENLHNTAIYGSLQTIVLLLYIYISVQKPWKKAKKQLSA